MPVYLDIFASLTFLYVLYRVLAKVRSGSSPLSHLPLPPGPKGLPVIGNLRDMPTSFEWKTYHEWSKEYNSDIIYLNIAGTKLVILDTIKAAEDLLDKRSSIYSERPRMPMANDLMGWNFSFGTMPYGPKWRQHRRLMQKEFSFRESLRYRPQLLRSARNFLNRMLDAPEDLRQNIKHMTGETIMAVTYGIEVKPRHDPFLKNAEAAVGGLTEAILPGAFLVDAFPILKYVPAWMPGAGFQRKARHWRKLKDIMVEVPFEETKKSLAKGTCIPCFTSFCLERTGLDALEGGETEDVVQNTAGSLFAAGVETTAITLASAILGLLGRPDILKQAREALDRVVQPGHLPDFEDEPSLPIITAIMKESLRWRDVTPIGIPHAIHVDDEYKGYRIPAGSIVAANSWAMLHDEKVYPEPFLFKPERFLTKDGQLDEGVLDPTHACFGFGRRICPGRFMASASIWIALASLIHSFDIEKAVDETGNDIEPDPKYFSTIFCYPDDYPFSIKLRSKGLEKIIRAYAKMDIH